MRQEIVGVSFWGKGGGGVGKERPSPILVYGDRFLRVKDGEPYAPSDVRG